MPFLFALAVLLLTVGHLWFAWTLWTNDQPIMAILLLLIPMPLVGLFAWYRVHWDAAYQAPAIAYLGGYLLVGLAGLMGS